ncbi:unnamed protein product, partial [Didymodactylos carnosus]
MQIEYVWPSLFEQSIVANPSLYWLNSSSPSSSSSMDSNLIYDQNYFEQQYCDVNNNNQTSTNQHMFNFGNSATADTLYDTLVNEQTTIKTKPMVAVYDSLREPINEIFFPQKVIKPLPIGAERKIASNVRDNYSVSTSSSLSTSSINSNCISHTQSSLILPTTVTITNATTTSNQQSPSAKSTLFHNSSNATMFMPKDQNYDNSQDTYVEVNPPVVYDNSDLQLNSTYPRISNMLHRSLISPTSRTPPSKQISDINTMPAHSTIEQQLRRVVIDQATSNNSKTLSCPMSSKKTQQQQQVQSVCTYPNYQSLPVQYSLPEINRLSFDNNSPRLNYRSMYNDQNQMFSTQFAQSINVTSQAALCASAAAAQIAQAAVQLTAAIVHK